MKSLVLSLAVIFSGCMATAPVEKKEKKIDPRCLQKGESGRCRAYMPRYYFDNESHTCKEFIWGGCGGVVPFKTMKSCRDTCL
ncbi:MAG: BPTI/Kunitz domain-containing protein [Campylobacterota bacterium]|nr:BPTI/Kunitz domain-containing protein [Campylobacterota bacterium]